MKSIKTLLAVAVAVGGMMVAVDAQAQAKHGGVYRGSSHGGWHGGGHWHGSYWGPRVGLYFGAPLLFGAYAWGYPYYDYYGPRTVYREVIREPEFIESVRERPAPQMSPPDASAPGAPSQGPLYMNYCASAKAYFPKVSSCPEGWKFISPTQ